MAKSIVLSSGFAPAEAFPGAELADLAADILRNHADEALRSEAEDTEHAEHAGRGGMHEAAVQRLGGLVVDDLGLVTGHDFSARAGADPFLPRAAENVQHPARAAAVHALMRGTQSGRESAVPAPIEPPVVRPMWQTTMSAPACAIACAFSSEKT